MAVRTYCARMIVTLKNGVLDPQGKAIEGSLDALGFAGLQAVRQGKVFDIKLEAGTEKAAIDQLNAMGEKLLANLVIEDFSVEISS